MKKSPLPLTGFCHFCGEPTKNRFCNPGHNAAYLMRKRREKEQQKVNTKPPKLIARRATDKQIAAAIERICQRAEREGTLGWATLAPMKQLQKKTSKKRAK